MTLKKKHRQHHVWRHYLDDWSTNGNLWSRRDGNPFEVSSQNIGHKRDFYRLRDMSEQELDIVVKTVIQPLKPSRRQLAEDWVPHFTELFRIRRRYDASGRQNAEIAALLESYINNLKENLHAGLESRALPFLAGLRTANGRILDDNEGAYFYTWFLAAQYFRTPRLLASVRSKEAEGGTAEPKTATGSWLPTDPYLPDARRGL